MELRLNSRRLRSLPFARKSFLVLDSTHPPTLLVFRLTKPASDSTRLINKLLHFIRLLSWEIIIHSFQFFNSFIRRNANTQFTHGACFSRCGSSAAALQLHPHLRPRGKDEAKILLIFLILNILNCTSPPTSRPFPARSVPSRRMKSRLYSRISDEVKEDKQMRKQKGRELLFVFIASTARRKHTTN